MRVKTFDILLIRLYEAEEIIALLMWIYNTIFYIKFRFNFITAVESDAFEVFRIQFSLLKDAKGTNLTCCVLNQDSSYKKTYYVSSVYPRLKAFVSNRPGIKP